MLAMLLAMTSMLSSWANMPVAAELSARMVRVSAAQAVLRVRHLGELLDGLLVQFALLLEQRRHLLIGARDLDHAGDLDHRVDVRLLEHALLDLRGGVGRGGDAGRRGVQIVALLLQEPRL